MSISKDYSSEVSFNIKKIQSSPLDSLNKYLAARDVSPIRSQLQTSWDHASGRTKRYYTRKAGQAVATMVKDVAPAETGPLYSALCSSDFLRKDDARIDVLEMLGDESSVLVVQDWAMKYLPRKYRESQTDWFVNAVFLGISALYSGRLATNFKC